MAQRLSPHRLSHAASPDGTAEIATLAPDSRLAGTFNGIYGYREETGSPLRRREKAQAHVVLIFDLGPTLRFLDPVSERLTATHDGGFVAGLFGGPVLTETSGRQAGVQVNFTLAGARRFFGPGLGEMADQVVDLGAVLGPEGRRLTDRLGNARDWPARMALVEEMMLARFAAEAPAPDVADMALRRLNRSHGALGIDALARELDCSRKHLTQSIRRAYGLPPKQIARMLRFNRAAARLEAMATPDMAAVAHACGYADQAHMTRDFKEFSGYPPATFLRQRLPGEQGLAG